MEKCECCGIDLCLVFKINAILKPYDGDNAPTGPQILCPECTLHFIAISVQAVKDSNLKENKNGTF